MTRVDTQCVYHPLHDVVVNGGWSLMRGVVNEGFYCTDTLTAGMNGYRITSIILWP